MNFFYNIFYSFPVQLIINNLKKNQILLLLWFTLFGVTTQAFGRQLGIPFLFVDPEYMDAVNFNSLFIFGVSVGIFTIAFFITSYILDGYRFDFLGTVKKPFATFCVNNSLLPIAYVITHFISFYRFQITSGHSSVQKIIWDEFGFLLGVLITMGLTLLYFRFTNKDIFKLLTKNLDTQLKKNTMTRVNVMKKIDNAKRKKFKIKYYLDINFRVRAIDHEVTYDRSAILKIFDQNHLNAVFVEIVAVVCILLLSFFKDYPAFQIPAGASAVLLYAVAVMFTGAFSYWLRGWSITALIILVLGYNVLLKTEIIDTTYPAFGLNYKTEKAEYSLARINQLNSKENYQNDYNQTIDILNNWKAKFSNEKKPKMVFLCMSGGGQRAAVWSVRTLQYADSILDGRLFDQTMLMSGASGGLIGASYYRELKLREQQGEDVNPYNKAYLDNISKDILNPIILNFVVNDLFLRLQKFKDGPYTYPEGRGYALEQELNQNTEFMMDKRIMDYYEPEYNADIPMLIAAPTIINDGRKLFISPQRVSYMGATAIDSDEVNQDSKGIEFLRFYEEQDAANLRFLTTLRMCATFPYVTPNVSLPSDPPMEIMDAGLSDNFGITDALRFIYVFQDWIKTNTSGVVLVSIRDTDRERGIEKNYEPSIFQKVFNPIGSLYKNWNNMQDLNNDKLIEYAQGWYGSDLDFISFEYRPKPKDWESLVESGNWELLQKKLNQERASLSWHLTEREKRSIYNSINEEYNLSSLEELKKLLLEE